MKNLGNGVFEDQLSNNRPIIIDCPKQKVTLENENHKVTFQFQEEIKISDYEALKRDLETKIK